MDAKTLREKYLKFFESKGHKRIPSALLVPEDDPSVLFTTAGMHPLVPFLLGQPHPEGKRLTNVQKCLRTDDIDEVGDFFHHTFFEMLGNWSLGDYFKKEAIEWSFEFLTSPDQLNIPKERLAVSVFAGDSDAPFDEESYNFWVDLGIPPERIAKLPKKNNWWGPVGETGPCGPDTEMFIWMGEGSVPQKFDPEDFCWVEIWNDVFMQFNKNQQGKYESLKQKNVDTGMGLERTLAVVNGLTDNYKTELFRPIIKKIEEISGKRYDERKRDFRVIADHVKAAVFIASEKVKSSNTAQGYVLRRLIRRAVCKGKSIGINHLFIKFIAESVLEIYSDSYPELKKNSQTIFATLIEEEQRFQGTIDRVEQYREDLEQAIKNKLVKKIKNVPIISGPKTASGAYVYENYQSYGVPPDLSQEVVKEMGLEFDQERYDEAFKKHQELSRTASAGMFKGGLGEQSEMATKYHTTTHLLHAALRQVLGTHVQQKGSNITAERLRFDFSHPEKMTEQQLKQVEDLVNEKIKEGLEITSEAMDKEEALKSGALGFFAEKYGEKVSVYSIGDPSTGSGFPFSREICGGPHVKNTRELGRFKIIKEEAVSAGIRRIRAVLENLS